MTFRSHAARVAALLMLLLLLGFQAAGIAAPSTPNDPDQGASWGAIASRRGWYGYAFNHKSVDAAERAARAQCDRAAGRSGPCEVRIHFDRSCAALATGNFGEWGAASAATTQAAGQAAIAQCESHLPTEPCKIVVSACSR
ncbi:DUF4189 domain-containing protein [Variovorax saccharolyticus]|uniref:DUF4189 domain-containing protein n=1 Tax=Variovorax saccharolyticus TaxID=3053516 RepID=UPI002574A3E8|nr:DUF4189 domain-containing protein [Variovorax sp. J31P216]MDM0026387.1 DUF4189 domain-containing protein [Variovorax sp. J31P216]